jgi:hypothetical protein
MALLFEWDPGKARSNPRAGEQPVVMLLEEATLPTAVR